MLTQKTDGEKEEAKNVNAPNPLVPNFELKILNFTKNEDIENKQTIIDFAHHIHTMDGTLKRAREMLGTFRERTDNERRQLSLLHFLRTKY